MKELVKLFIGVFACFIPIAMHAQSPSMESVPLHVCSGLPCIDATVEDGRQLRLLIDTGDVNALLDDSAASRLNLQERPAHGADGKPVAGYHLASLRGLKIGATRLDDVLVIVTSLRAMTDDHAPDADGFLTYPAFKDRILRLDFAHKLLSFSKPIASSVACTGSCGTLQYPSFGKTGPKIVLSSSFSVNGKTVSAQIDTLFTGTLLVYPQAVSRLDLRKESESKSTAFFPYTDSGVEMTRGKANTISFLDVPLAQNSSLYFATPKVHTPDEMFDATVGTAVLMQSIVTFDFHDNWISVARQ